MGKEIIKFMAALPPSSRAIQFGHEETKITLVVPKQYLDEAMKLTKSHGKVLAVAIRIQEPEKQNRIIP